MNQSLGLIGLFLLINFSSFLCFWLFNIREQKIIGKFLFNKYRGIKEKAIGFYARPDSDFLRINLDFTLLVLLSILFSDLSSSAWWLIFNKLILFFGFVYLIYIAAIFFIFKRVPSLKSDFHFIKIGIMVANDKLLLFVIGLITLLIGLWFLSDFFVDIFYDLLRDTDKSFVLTFLVGIFSILGLYKLTSYPYKAQHFRTSLSPIVHFIRNLKFSKRYDYIYKKDQSYFEGLNQYNNFELAEKPNIIIVAIESYGAVVLQDEDLKVHFEQKLTEFEKDVTSNNWSMQSTFSEAPIFAGGSWLCYSSLLYGIPLNDIALYNVLFQNHKAFDKYDSLLHFLKKQGYYNNLLTPIGGYDKSIDWDMIKKAYQYDKFYGFNDLNYSGKTLSFIKLGKVAPDEYALNYTYEQIQKNKVQPFSLFYPTLNSHCFFDTPINTEKEWQDYQTKEFETTGELKKDLKEKYKLAIDYQLSFLKNFLLKNDLSNTIVVLFGDHQPPFIAKQENGNHTLLHVLSKDNKFGKAFEKHGFASSIKKLIDQKNTIKHEAFYSLFMQEFSNNYGQDKNIKFPIFKDGINLK